jgi:hypothetical protein
MKVFRIPPSQHSVDPFVKPSISQSQHRQSDTWALLMSSANLGFYCWPCNGNKFSTLTLPWFSPKSHGQANPHGHTWYRLRPRAGLWHRQRAHHHHPRTAGRARLFIPRAVRRSQGHICLIARFFICYGLDDSHTIDLIPISRQSTLKYVWSPSLPSRDLHGGGVPLSAALTHAPAIGVWLQPEEGDVLPWAEAFTSGRRWQVLGLLLPRPWATLLLPAASASTESRPMAAGWPRGTWMAWRSYFSLPLMP